LRNEKQALFGIFALSVGIFSLRVQGKNQTNEAKDKTSSWSASQLRRAVFFINSLFVSNTFD
jgi:hypothetical protein